ncbi:MAG TPA: hypothetical protein VF181_08420 [Balneolaceae bacterium]
MVTERVKKILLITILINIVLVATHKGEFWPFSIFPMFSISGQPFLRGVVEEVENIDRPNLWRVKPLYKIEERVISLQEYGINPFDFANYIKKTKYWDAEKINGLRSTFQIECYSDKMWMITRVKGFFNDDNEIVIYTYPMFLLTGDTTYKNPNLSTIAKIDE